MTELFEFTYSDRIRNTVNEKLKELLEQSTCSKRQIAAVMWSYDDGFFTEGYNGPPEGFESYCRSCPRSDHATGERMEICPAVHAEVAAILDAARIGVPTNKGALFITCALPCKDCMKELARAGITHIISPYPLEYVEENEALKQADTYNFPMARSFMETCGIQYIHDPKLVKNR